MSKTKTVFVFLVLFACINVSWSTNSGIRLLTFQNEPVSLTDVLSNDTHRGKLTLAMVWATDCPPCEEQKPMIQQFHNDYSETVATVVGIAIDGLKDVDEVNRLITKHDPSYPNYLADPETFLGDYEFVTAKSFNGAPSYIIFDDKGNALAVASGPVTREQLDAAVSM